MSINADKVNLLHIEPTTRCNASCPGCPRNNNGFGVREDLIIGDVDPNIIIDTANQFPYLKVIHLCGNLGDPIAYKHLNGLIDKIIIQNKYFWDEFDSGRSIQPQHHWFIDIHTNGSLRSVKWWQELGKKCDDHFYRLHKIVFGIDGLKDTNHIYRQATNFNKIIDNAKAFIDTGGFAEWQFLIFKHNEHQVEEAKQLSESIGFKRFYTRQPWFTKAFHWRTNEEYYLEPGTIFGDIQRPNDMYEENIEPSSELYTDNIYVEKGNCMHLDIHKDNSNLHSMFMSIDGKVMPCCHWSNNFDYKEKYDIKTLDIKNEFDNNEYRLTCRAICGSIK
jgi:MoaA/NifB/PqqE/SkfB family radical SAM enzyme